MSVNTVTSITSVLQNYFKLFFSLTKYKVSLMKFVVFQMTVIYLTRHNSMAIISNVPLFHFIDELSKSYNYKTTPFVKTREKM
jgi:hypothetical protein